MGRRSTLSALGVAAALVACDGGSASTSTPPGELCAPAVVEVVELWTGDAATAEVVESSCVVSGPLSTYDVVYDVDRHEIRVTWRGIDGFVVADELLADFLTQLVFEDRRDAAAITQRESLLSLDLADEPSQCGVTLTAGRGDWRVVAVPSNDMVERTEYFAAAPVGWVDFGLGFPGVVCTDIADDIREPAVEARWPLRFAGVSFMLQPTAGDACGPATMTIERAEALAPDGSVVDLGPLQLANTQFGVWVPSECRLPIPD